MKTDNHRHPVTSVSVSTSEQVLKDQNTDCPGCIHKCITLKQQQLTFSDERFKREMVQNMWLNQEKRVETDSDKEEETALCVHAQFNLRLPVHGLGNILVALY